MQQIITDAGCLRCHTSTPDLPFYASMPVAGKIVMEDVSKAYRAFDMTQMEADLEAGHLDHNSIMEEFDELYNREQDLIYGTN